MRPSIMATHRGLERRFEKTANLPKWPQISPVRNSMTVTRHLLTDVPKSQLF